MGKQSNEHNNYLQDATTRYHNALPGSPGEEYLGNRGLTQIENFKLGYVGVPLPGHEQHKGCLAIPYIRRSPAGAWRVVSIKFRCVQQHNHKEQGHPKYKLHTGHSPMLFNTVAFDQTEDTIGICEGELDAIAASISGVPSVGVAGVESWRDHFAVPFQGYDTVYIFADNDDAGQGMKFADKIAGILKNTRVIPCEKGMDLNDELVQYGQQHIRNKIG